MTTSRKRKLVEVRPGRTYFEADEDGVLTPLSTQSRNVSSHFRNYNTFMKYFIGEGVSIAIHKQLGSDAQYLGILGAYLGYDNELNIKKFKRTLELSDNAFYALRKRLVANAIIAEKDGEWYVNPIVMLRGDIISSSLWSLFKDNTMKLYGISIE